MALARSTVEHPTTDLTEVMAGLVVDSTGQAPLVPLRARGDDFPREGSGMTSMAGLGAMGHLARIPPP